MLFCANAGAADGNVTIKAAIPFYTERFDWAVGQGGNDGKWDVKYADPLNVDRGEMRFEYCWECNKSVCIGASYAGRVTIKDIPQTDGFVTVRAGAFLTENRDKAKVIFNKLIKNSRITVEPGKFSCIRKEFYDDGNERTLIIEGDENDKDNFKFFIDDIVVYSVTSDIEQLKTASRILLAAGAYSEEQIGLLQEIVKENENLTSIDLQSAGISGKFHLEPANPNCIIYDPNNCVTNTVNTARSQDSLNVVNSYVCDSLVITDGYPFDAIYDFTAANVSYDREFADTGESRFSTICLPFSISKDDAKIASLLEFKEYRAEDAQVVFDDADAIQSNEPYVISVSDMHPFLDMRNVNAEVVATTPHPVWKETAYEALPEEKEQSRVCIFCGTYDERTGIASDTLNVYSFSDGKFMQVGDSCTFKPFRACLTIDKNAAAPAGELYLADSQGLVGVSGIQAAGKRQPSAVFSLDGMLVRKEADPENSTKGLAKGIYIIDGKKTVVK